MSATTRSSRAGHYVLAAMICVLSLAFFLEWRASRAAAERISGEVGRALGDLGRTQEVLSSRLGSIASSLQDMQDALVARDAVLARIDRLLQTVAGSGEAQTVPASAAIEEAAPPPSQDGGLPFAVEGLPPLPDGLHPKSFLADDRLFELVTEFRKDPERQLDGVETAQALNILAETRARIEVLKSRIQLATLKGAQKLFERGDYIDYAPGEKYHGEMGLISFGERSEEGDMRMFYLYREEFPEIYSMKEEAQQLPAIGIRRLLGLINPHGG